MPGDQCFRLLAGLGRVVCHAASKLASRSRLQYALSASTISSSPLTTFSNSRRSCTLAAVSVTARISVCVSSTATGALFHRVARVAVATRFIFPGWRAAGGLQQRRGHQGAGLQYQALLLQLPVDRASSFSCRPCARSRLRKLTSAVSSGTASCKPRPTNRRQLKRSPTSSSHCGSDSRSSAGADSS